MIQEINTRQMAQQSPEWDAKLSLADMLKKATFFILHRENVVLVSVVLSDHTTNGNKFYDNYGLSHDRYGVTYESDGSIRADYVAVLIESGKAELTQDPADVLHHIWACMNGQPPSPFITTA